MKVPYALSVLAQSYSNSQFFLIPYILVQDRKNISSILLRSVSGAYKLNWLAAD